jgi:hypothetical protein
MAVEDMGPRTPWDVLVIDGKELSAQVIVEAEKKSRLDTKETPGTIGATTTNTGTAPGTATIRLRCFTALAIEEWAELRPQLQAAARSKTPKAISVYHPALAVLGIDALMLDSSSAPKSSGPGGYMEIVTKWVEFFPIRVNGVHTALGTDRVTSTPVVAPQFKKAEKPSHGGPPAPK